MVFLLFTGGNEGLWMKMDSAGGNTKVALHQSDNMDEDLKRVSSAIHSLCVLRSKGDEYQHPKEFIRKLDSRISILPGIMDVSPEEKLAGRVADELQRDLPEILLLGCFMEPGTSIMLAPQPIIYVPKELDADNLIRVLENITKKK